MFAMPDEKIPNWNEDIAQLKWKTEIEEKESLLEGSKTEEKKRTYGRMKLQKEVIG